jgi:3-methyladenine DNA glycosylase Tag
MTPPEQIEDPSPADILETITKAVFQAGMSWRVVEAKWPGFREAFDGFDPARVAALTPDDVAGLKEDTRIIRNGRKIEATVHNAEAIVALDQDTPGGIRGWLGSRGEFEETIDAMRNEFKFLGDMGAYYVLHVTGEPVPDHQDAMHVLGRRKR